MTLNNRRERIVYFLAYSVLFVVSLAGNLYYSYFVVSPLNSVFSDMGSYIEQGITFTYGQSALTGYDTIYPPGLRMVYGFLFWALGPANGFHAIIVMQAFMLACINVLVGLTAFELFGRRGPALALAWIVTAFWPFWGLIGFFMAELPVIFFMLLAQYLFVVALNRGASAIALFNVGVISGLAMFFKGQAVSAFVAAWLVLLLLRVGYSRRLWIVFLTAGFFLPVGLLMIANHKLMLAHPQLKTNAGYFVAAYDGYNLFLAQSRRHTLAALEEIAPNGAGFVFHIFSNDTKDEKHRFLPPLMAGESILNRAYFQQQALELIKADPLRQLGRAVVSVRELFITGEGWPFDTIPVPIGTHQGWHLARMILVGIPALLSILLALSGYYRWQVAVVALPILGMMGLAVLYSGQPRYILPFQYHLFLLAVPAYLLRIGQLRRAWA